MNIQVIKRAYRQIIAMVNYIELKIPGFDEGEGVKLTKRKYDNTTAAFLLALLLLILLLVLQLALLALLLLLLLL